MRAITFILLLILRMNGFSSSAPVFDVSVEKAVEAEKYSTAFNLLAMAFKKSSSLNIDTLSYNLYQTTECLFKIRNIKNLETMLQLCENNWQILNPYYLAKINVIKYNYWKEKGNLDKAELLLNTAINNCKYPDVQIDYMLSLASLNLIKEEAEKGEKLYRQVYYSQTDSLQLAAACNGIGACFAYNSKYDSAQYYYKIALQLYEKKLGKWNTRTAQVSYNLALIANKFGDYISSEKTIQRVLKIYQTKLGEKHIRTAEAYGELGSIYMLQDNLEKALYYITKERDILSALYNNKHASIAYSYLNSGKIYFYLDDLANAEQELKKGIELLTSLNSTNSNIYTQLVIELARVRNKQTDYIQSSALLNSLLLNQALEDEFKADIYLQLGENYLQINESAKAQTYFQLANKIYPEIYGDKNVYSTDALIGISNCYLQSKDFINANEFARAASQKTIQNNKIIFPYDHWECVTQLLKCKKMLNNKQIQSKQSIENDIELIKGALQEANQIKQTYYSSGSQLHYNEKMAELNQLGIYFLTHFYKTTDIYFLDNLLFFTENNKANLLRNKIINYTADEILPPRERAKSLAIIGKLNYFISLNENQETTDFNINDSILFYQDQYEVFTKSIEKKYPKIYRLKYGNQSLTVKQIQKSLPKNKTFLEYCDDNENYYCLVISKNNITYKICGNKNKIDKLVESYLSSVIDKKADDKLSQHLYQYLLPKSFTEDLVVSSDGMLQRISFDALQNDKSDYLVNQHAVQYAFSANTYFNHQPDIKNKKIIAFYPDFANSAYAVLNNQKEHEALKAFSDYYVYHQQQANKGNFITQCNSAGIIHVASHLIIDTLSPLKSFLVFQPNNNYTLSINEIWKLNANCQLITLASCQSNFGKQQNGEGIQNFAWAFHYAGARNILSTQWNASDKSTSAIISDFYKNLKNGKSKQEALHLAKINYLKNTDAMGAQPFFWSNFYLYGDESELNISPHFLVKFWRMPIFLLLLCYLAIVIIRKVYRKQQYDHL